MKKELKFTILVVRNRKALSLSVILNEVKNLVLCPFTQGIKDEILRRYAPQDDREGLFSNN